MYIYTCIYIALTNKDDVCTCIFEHRPHRDCSHRRHCAIAGLKESRHVVVVIYSTQTLKPRGISGEPQHLAMRASSFIFFILKKKYNARE